MRRARGLVAAASAVALTIGGAGAAAAAAPSGTTTGSAADIRVVDTDAPVAIRVGAPRQVLRITMITGAPAQLASVDLFDIGGPVAEPTAYAFGDLVGPEEGRPTVFKTQVGLDAVDVPGWGVSTWVFDGRGFGDGTRVVGALDVVIRAHSLLGLAASRSGSTVTVRGSARAFHNVEGRYVPWSGRPVSVQRWTGSAWVQVTGITTDPRGNLSTTVQVPASSTLRLVTPGTGGTWGAVSAPQTV
ncbi:hypothetical protein WDZ17_15000 [Pseudokineococcus basanitobsidens]|uniref:Uncharacterized protein n=1 Tax=Pseudokineococcus basanitobsidens TaxID=1926649 RepID=A0ABU8RNH2_9ACTN